MLYINKKYILTTHDWFYAPDGETYKAVFGTVKKIVDAKTELGIPTNRHSTNWYIEIGDMVVAGCQVFYFIKTNSCTFKPPTKETDHEGKTHINKCGLTRIYNADADESEA
jgi:hypothetical protein